MGRHPLMADPLRKYFHNILGFRPRHMDLYHIALTHKSKSGDIHGHKVNNERLEYLGDSVLGTVVAEYLYRRYPYQGEGFLTEMRSKIVSRASLNQLAQKIGLLEQIDYDRGQSGAFKSLGGNAFEALIGAIYLDRGYRVTRRIIIRHIMTQHMDIDQIEHQGWNYKGKLIDWGQRTGRKVSFQVERVIQPTRHSPKQYEVRVSLGGKPYESGIDATIKSAEQLAAEKTYLRLQEDLKKRERVTSNK